MRDKQLGVQDINCSNFNSFILQIDSVTCPYACFNVCNITE